MKHDVLTTEKLRKKFRNNFDLCNFAINIGQSEIMNDPESTSLRKILAIVDIRASEAPHSEE